MSTSSVFCSLGDSRSWTDLVTNLVFLSDVRLDKNLEQLTGWGTMPEELLPPFLHEATHHWCFLSPVGFTLASLQLQARRRALLLLNEQEHDRRSELEFGLLEDLIRFETASAYLRPLAEGLALFAEFDAMTKTESSVFSLPLEMASYFFGYWNLYQPKFGPTALLTNALRFMRLDKRCIQRKVSLLGYPLAYTGGGYLPGYLAVRSLWLQAASRDGRLLNETDLALMYMRSFFFDDKGLVAKLLDPSTEELASANAIGNYLTERIYTFLTEVQKIDIETYEREVLAGEKEQSKLRFTCLRIKQELYDMGERLSTELMDQLKTSKIEEVDDLLRLLEVDLLNRRDIMYLGSLPVEVSVDHDGRFRVLHGGVLVTDGQTLEGVEAGTGAGSIDLFFSMLSTFKYRVVAITRGRELVAKRLVGTESMTKDSSDRFNQFETNRTVLQTRNDELRQAVEKVIAGSWMEIALEHIRRHLPTQVERLYLPLALYYVAHDKLDSDYAIMREKGLLPILDWDRDLVEGVALLGLCCSALTPDRPFVSAWFEKAGLDLDRTLSDILRCTKEYGIPKVFDDGRQLLSIV